MKYISICLILIVIAGCLPGTSSVRYSIENDRDEDNKFSTTRQTGNLVYSTGQEAISMNLSKTTWDDGLISYLMSVHLNLEDWIFIGSGSSLQLLLDNELIVLSGNGSLDHRKVQDNSTVIESAYYQINIAEIQKLANARFATVRIQGSKGRREFGLKTKHIKRFQEFYAVTR